MITFATICDRSFLSVLILSLFFSGEPANAQAVSNAQVSAAAVARESFETLKRNDIPAFVSLFHPVEFKRFKAFALKVFEYGEPDKDVRQIRALFAPYDSVESIDTAHGSDLLTVFLKNTLAAIPGFDEIFSEAKLQILGEIEDTHDRVCVITRTVLPRPSPVSCQKSDGRWYQLLNVDTMRMITAFERKEHFRRKNVPIDELPKKMAISNIEVLGYVSDGDDLAQVLCRITMKTDDYIFPVLGCYPVRNGEPAWEHLNDADKTELVESLRVKWTR
jgi:hypothetical protein